MIKRFLEWIKFKEKLHEKNSAPPLVKERDIWWVSFGENVGSEINGKNRKFSRPGLILKKLTHSFYLIAPTTSRKKIGSWYVPIQNEGLTTYVCLHQIRAIDHRRIFDQLGRISTVDFAKVKEGFFELYK